MRKAMSIIICMSIIFTPVVKSLANPSQADISTGELRDLMRENLEAVARQISKIQNTVSLRRANYQEQFEKIYRDLDELKQLSGLIKPLESGLSSVERLQLEYASGLSSIDEMTSEIAGLRSAVEIAQKSANDANEWASRIVWVISLVSAIVSILVIIIGLFFSKRFMDLHAETRVATALLERLENKSDGV